MSHSQSEVGVPSKNLGKGSLSCNKLSSLFREMGLFPLIQKCPSKTQPALTKISHLILSKQVREIQVKIKQMVDN